MADFILYFDSGHTETIAWDDLNINCETDYTLAEKTPGDILDEIVEAQISTHGDIWWSMLTLPEETSRIGNDAFHSCEYLYEIVCPRDLKEIGSYAFAFSGLSAAVSFYDASVTQISEGAFYNCQSLETFVSSPGVTVIGSRAFEGCSALKSITLSGSPSLGLTEVKTDAFKHCSSLETVIIPSNSLLNWYDIYFWNEYSNPLAYALYFKEGGEDADPLTKLEVSDSITQIEQYTFAGYLGLKEVVFSANIQSVGPSAFKNCSNLQKVIFNEDSNLQTIYSQAFQECSRLSGIAFPKSLKQIGECAFQGCSQLKEITIPNTITTLGKGAFQECSNLTEISLPFTGGSRPSSITHFGYIFGAESYEEQYKSIPRTLKIVAITDGTQIPDYAFYNSFIQQITIPKSIITIGQYAFQACSSLNSVSFAEDSELTTIDSYAFYGCSSLKTIAIPNKAQKIGTWAFGYCSNLSEINIPSTVTSIEEKAFEECNSLWDWEDGVRYIDNCAIECDSYNRATISIRSGTRLIADAAVQSYGCTRVKLEDGLLYIGKNAFANCSSLMRINIPASVVQVKEDAFANCQSLSRVDITDITAWLNIDFSGSDMDLTDFGYDFYLNDEELTELVIPDGTTTIRSFAFICCTSIKSVTIPSSVQEMGYAAFGLCTSLERVSFVDNSQLISLPLEAFAVCVDLVDIDFGKNSKITSIGQSAFAACASLERVKLPFQIAELGRTAFDECTSLTEIMVPNTIQKIDEYAFRDTALAAVYYRGTSSEWANVSIVDDNADLTSATIYYKYEDQVIKAGTYRFNRVLVGKNNNPNHELTPFICDTVTYEGFAYDGAATGGVKLAYGATWSLNEDTVVYTPSSGWGDIKNRIVQFAEDIPVSNIFYAWLILNTVRINEDGTTLEPGFYGSDGTLLYSWDYLVKTYGMDCAKDYTATNSAIETTSPAYLLAEKDELKSTTMIVFPWYLTKIGAYAFYNCSTLVEIKLGENIEEIGESAFRNCTSLIGLSLPAGVATLNTSVFRGCTSLLTVALSKRLQVIPQSSFNGCSKLTALIVPTSVSKIKALAFFDNNQLNAVYYYGSQEDWQTLINNSATNVKPETASEYNYNSALEQIATLGQGTYRFKKALDAPDFLCPGEQLVTHFPFTVADVSIASDGAGQLGTATCANIALTQNSDASINAEYLVIERDDAETFQLLTVYEGQSSGTKWIKGEAWRIITLENDTDIPGEFYDWFTIYAISVTSIEGAWRFHDSINASASSLEPEEVSFTVNYHNQGADRETIECHMLELSDDIHITYITSSTEYDVYTDNGWTNPSLQTIDFKQAQYVSTAFNTWLRANAEQQVAISGSWRITPTADSITDSFNQYVLCTADHYNEDTGTPLHLSIYQCTITQDGVLFTASEGTLDLENGWSFTLNFGATPQWVSEEFKTWLEERVGKAAEKKIIKQGLYTLRSNITTIVTSGVYNTFEPLQFTTHNISNAQDFYCSGMQFKQNDAGEIDITYISYSNWTEGTEKPEEGLEELEAFVDTKPSDTDPWLLSIQVFENTAVSSEFYNWFIENVLEAYSLIDYLHDYSFLKALDYSHTKTLYVQIEVLNANDEALATIEGQCTGGSISLNAKSAMRRSGSLTMIADDNNKNLTDINNLIAINKRILVQVGIKNETTQYQNSPILWFPMGVFIITSANIAKNQSGINISLSFKDKMVLLNGEVEGTFSGPVTHSPVYVEDNTVTAGYRTEGVKFYDLLYTLITEFGNLPANQVVIDGLAARVKNTTRYTDDSNTEFWLYPTIVEGKVKGWNYAGTLDPGQEDKVDSKYKRSSGDNIGYQYTDFIYPLDKDLVSQPGESIESVLQKISKALGNYEYFFDVQGIFHFQEIRNGLNQGSAKDDLAEAINDQYLAEKDSSDKIVYDFHNDELFVSIAENPQYQNVKNAFVVWGEKKGTKTPIRYHLIVDVPPALSEDKTYEFYTKDSTYITNGTAVSYKRGYRTQQTGTTACTVTLAVGADWRVVLYYELLTGEREAPYAKEYIEEFPKHYDIIEQEWLVAEEDFSYCLDMLNPAEINNPLIAQLGVGNIGYRLKAENSKDVNVLKPQKAPNVIIINEDDTNAEELKKEAEANDQYWVEIPNEVMEKAALGTSEYAAYDYVRSELHSSLSYLDTVQISCIPIYYLEPGQRIHVTNPDVGINGDYIIQTMSIPLAVDGTMSISATRAIERI